MTSLSIFFVSLVKFSYWSKFQVNIITGPEIMTICFYKGLTRNQEIRNTLVWLLPNIQRLGWVKITKLSTNVSSRMLLNAAKCNGYSFDRVWVIKGRSTTDGGKEGIVTQLPGFRLIPAIIAQNFIPIAEL